MRVLGLGRWVGVAVLVCGLGALAQPTVPLTVQIQDRAGVFVADVPVDIFAEHGGPEMQLPNGGSKILPVVSANTDSQGYLRFALVPGEYSVHVRAGFTGTMWAVLHVLDEPPHPMVLRTVPTDTPVEVNADTSDPNLFPQPESTPITAMIQGAPGQVPVPAAGYTAVTVVVTGPDGAVVAGAEIRVTPGSPAGDTLIADEQGRAQLGMPAGEYTLHVSAQGFAGADKSLVVADKPQTLTVALGAAPSSGGTEAAGAAPMSPGAVPLGMTEGNAASGGTQAAPAAVLTILGANGERGVFTPQTLREYPQTTVTVMDHHTNKKVTYGGVPLMDLLAKLGVPKGAMGKALAQYVVATGSDGFEAVLSLGEVDPEMHPGTVLVADALDGKPMDAKAGPFRLVVSEDKKASRGVRNLVKLEVRTAE